MSDMRKRTMLAVTMLALSCGLAGCIATADVSYSEYRYDPGFQTERVYESRVYGDTWRGFGNEECRAVVRRQVDMFGDVTTEEVTVCDRP